MRAPALSLRRGASAASRLLSTRACLDPSPGAAVAAGPERGLYGIEVLKTARGFRRFVDEAIERTGELVSYISQLPASVEIIRAMDEISDTVCSVVDSAELCRNTHPDREYVEEANQASMRIHDYIHFLNTNHTLYNAVIKAEQEATFPTREAGRMAHSLRADFEKGGIHLCARKLDRVNQLNTEISLLSREFNENIIIDPGSVDVFPASCIPKHMHHHLRPIYRPISAASGVGDMQKEKGFQITTDPATLSSILKWVPNSEVRKRAYITGNSVPHANLGVLDKLTAARHELAQTMGCKSYSELAIRTNMAASPEVVMSFLLELSEIVREKADEEFEKIKEFKRLKDGERCGDLEPWDESYYAGILKSSAHDLDSSVVASYFPLSCCINGLKSIVKSLFGATFYTVPLAPGESWHPSVLKMSLHHPNEGDLGFLYLDLYSRKGKYPGCAHFAIRGGRQLSEKEYQLPVVALVCNFSTSSGSSNARLNHGEVETLFHEFGHALHSLVSRTDYQHFSGTRVVLDFAETPANLFEYYAWDYRVLRTFARHYSTGDVIPKKLVEAMNDARSMFAATELQRQIFYSLIDQTLFGEQQSSISDTVSVVRDLKKQYTSWNHVDGTHWHTRFSHLINYGAGYYSYLYAKCFASTIWQEVCSDDPLSPTTGSFIRTKFLQHGGAKDPSDLLKDLAGDGIIRYCGGGIIPDASCLCKEMNL
uniref:Mitochondrial intermediate peptidase n=1 Tax=Anthurium amnicola TaxID=1678845 RepID=A0A1D1YPQ1_9ARAE